MTTDRLHRAPDEVPASDHPADEVLRLAPLTYGQDDPARWAEARRLLAEHPEIAGANIHTAVVAGDASQVQRLLRDDLSSARAEGGPHRWEPLFYLAYARHDPEVALDTVLAIATLLLEAGADPNVGYLWHGLPTPFTALTGAFGHGELGPVVQPAHPHSIALARLLLEAGADPNDGQALYNRQFEPEDDHLQLLLAHGLGQGDGGPWRALQGDAVAAPEELVQGQLGWAIIHGFEHRVRLLAEHGAALDRTDADGRTPSEQAALSGDVGIVALLGSLGATAPDLHGVDTMVAALLSGDRRAADDVEAISPGILAATRAARPGLAVWAASRGRADAVALLVELGFDVDALGRADVPPRAALADRAAHRGRPGRRRAGSAAAVPGRRPDDRGCPLRGHRPRLGPPPRPTRAGGAPRAAGPARVLDLNAGRSPQGHLVATRIGKAAA